MLLALDIETKCNQKCEKKCDHGLVPNRSEITLIGVYGFDGDTLIRKAMRPLEFPAFLDEYKDKNVTYVGQNFKFDLLHLWSKGYRIPLTAWVGDTQLAASVIAEKIPESYLEEYNRLRTEKNKELPKGYGHRQAGQYSLKTMAPYFLKVPPFWEDPTNHDNVEYNLLDCEYTYRLWRGFEARMVKDETLHFHNDRLLPWAKLLMLAEHRGVMLDCALVDELEKEALIEASLLEKKINLEWSEKIALFEARTEKEFNLDSPLQMQDFLKVEMGQDIRNAKEKESAGKEVLQGLVADGFEELKLVLDYRHHKKLATSFYPSYREMQIAGTIHPSYNITGTRTGRLSCSSPNVQQLPGDLHRLFKARPGHAFICRDLAAIEPRLAAYYTQDRLLCQIMLEDRDFHSLNAILMFDLDCTEREVKTKYPNFRKIAKACGLALLYGAGANRIQATAQQSGVQLSSDKARTIYRNFKQGYHEAFRFKLELDQLAEREGVATFFGRKHWYPNRDEIYMKAFNTLIQSSASDLLLASALKAKEKLAEQNVAAHPLLFIHDEVVFEVKQEKLDVAATIIDNSLTGWVLSTKHGHIPLKVEGKIAPYWAK